MRVEYRLPETYFSIAGTVEYETDAFGGVINGKPDETPKSGAAAAVAMGVRADSTTLHSATFEGSGSDISFSVTHTADQRLASVSFNTAGQGARVVSAGARVIAFVGGLIASVLGASTKAFGGPAALLRVRDEAGTAESEGEPRETPEDRAQTQWTADHADLVAHRTVHKTVLGEAQVALVAARRAAITADSEWEQSAALTRAGNLERVIRESRAEVDAVDALYRAWRAGTITARTEAWSFELAIHELPAWTAGPPDPACLEGDAKAAWDQLGVIVQVQALGNPFAKRTDTPDPKRPRDPRLEVVIGAFQAPQPAASTSDIRWRIPRPARIQIWRRTRDGGIVIDKTLTALMVDRDATVAMMTIDHRLFGESGGSLQFGELGAPTTITGSSKGAIGAIADAISGVPDQLVSGLESARKAEAAFAGLRDSRERRRLDSLKQQLEITRTQLDLKGLNATADDIAKLKRLEQDVLIAAAEETLAGPADPAAPSELEKAKAELELAKVRAALEKVNAGESVPDEASTAPLPIEAQLARLAERVALLEGKG